jgi:uncharacterized Zn finger protein
MNDNIEIDITCPNCSKETQVLVDIYSINEYDFDSRCELCGKTMDGIHLETKISDEVNDYFIGRAEQCSDYYNDR